MSYLLADQPNIDVNPNFLTGFIMLSSDDGIRWNAELYEVLLHIVCDVDIEGQDP